MEERCETCRFWKRYDAGDLVYGSPHLDEKGESVIGECHRFPPVLMKATVLPEETADESYVPGTYSDYWCGEFQPKREGLPTVDALTVEAKELVEDCLSDIHEKIQFFSVDGKHINTETLVALYPHLCVLVMNAFRKWGG